MKKISVILLVLLSFVGRAQEKQLWAKSFINAKAPKLEVQGWLTEIPKTEGKFILIDFWATWCAPCRKAIKELNNYNKKFEKEMVIIGISDEQPSKIKKLQNKINYYSAFDTQKKMYNQFKIRGIPHVVLIDPKGIVRWEGYPFLKGNELSEKTIENIIEKYKKTNITKI